MDNEKDADVGCMQESASCDSPKQPDCKIPAHVLRSAIGQAERNVDELNRRIKEESGERDNLARRIGAMQDHIDGLKRVASQAERHLRDLKRAFPNS